MATRSDNAAVEIAPAAPRGAAPRTADEGSGVVERRIKLLTSVLAPTTVLTALLFYYGYVATTAEYGYFGINLSSLRLSNQDFILRSAAALFLPVGALLFAALLGLWGHMAALRLIASGRRLRQIRIASICLAAAGVASVGRGIIGVLVPAVSRSEPMASSALCLGLGVAATAYGRYVWQAIAVPASKDSANSVLEQASVAIVLGILVLSLFWATNSFAAAYGRGSAVVAAEHLRDRPAVVLDTTEQLFVRYPGVHEFSLPASPGQRFLYRYRGFRLLIEASGRMFLLPEQWRKGSGAILVVRNDENVRLQLYR